MTLTSAARIVLVAITALLLQSRAAAQCLDWFQGGILPSQSGGVQQVDALAVHDSGAGPELYAVGTFFANNQNIYGLFRWNGSTWGSSLGSINNTVNSMVSWNGDLYICGRFTQAGGISASRIAKFNGSTFSTVGSGIDAGTTMVPYAGELYVAGPSLAGGNPVHGVASWNGTRWAPLGTANAGSQRDHCMSYDSARQRVVLFVPGQVFSETYEWDGTSWTKLATGGPSWRHWSTMAYDSLHGVTVLFGGQSNAGPQGDTWTWNGSAWTQLAVTGPSPRYQSAMAFDPSRGKLVLNGGRDDTFDRRGIRDTWEFDGSSWVQVSTTGPENRSNHAMVYNAAIGKVVLYGGAQDGSAIFNNFTWIWDGTTWTHPASAAGPGQRSFARMAYDSARQKIVLFSGNNAATSDTWEWNGTTWSQNNLAFQPPGRVSSAVAYDASRGTLVMYGGDISGQGTQSDTWTFTGSVWTPYFEGVDAPVLALATFNDGGGDALFLGGEFFHAGGQAVSRIARYRNGQWNSLGGGTIGDPNGVVHCLAAFNGKLYAGGDFMLMGGQACSRLAAWNGSWTAVNLGQSARIDALSVFNSNVLGSPLLLLQGSFPYNGNPGGTSFAAWNGTSMVALAGYVSAGPIRFAEFPYNGTPAMWMSAANNTYKGLWTLGAACTAPTITSHPTSITAIVGQNVNFSTTASGSPILTYQWRQNSVPIADLAGKRLGTTTPNLNIYGWSINDIGDYDCVVSNSAGASTCIAAHLTVNGSTPSGPVSITPIAVLNAAVPDRPGLSYTNFLAPIQSEDGSVAFLSNQSGNWAASRWINGVTTTVAWVGAPLPGITPAATANIIRDFTFGSAGDLFIDIDGLRQGSGFKGIWRSSPGLPLSKVVSWGDSVPGSGGATVTQFDTRFAVAGEGGQLAFSTLLHTPIGPDRPAFIARDAAGILTPLAIRGSPAPDRADAVFSISDESNPIKPAVSGQTIARLELYTTFTANDITRNVTGYWIGLPGAMVPLAVNGDPVPDATDDSIILNNSEAFQSDSGLVAYVRQTFTPPSSTNPSQVLLWNQGAQQVLLSVGDELAPGEIVSSIVHIVAINNNGEVVVWLQTRLDDVCCSSSHWLLSPDAAPILIARDGQQTLIGFPPGLDVLASGYTSLNDNGMLILHAHVSGSAGSGTGVLGWTRSHGLFPIVVPGTQIETAPGVFQTVAQSTVSSVRGAIYGPFNCRSLNNGGQLAISVSHQGGLSSVLVGQFEEFLTAWYPCAAVIEEPRDITVPGGGAIALDAAVTGSGVITLSWTHNGNPVVDDAHVSGSATSNLHIEPAGAADAGVYQLTASDSCGNVTSRLATVTVHCPADFDGDGTVDFFDYDAFVSCFEGQACPPGKTADFDSDGSADFFDYDAFVVAFESPC